MFFPLSTASQQQKEQKSIEFSIITRCTKPMMLHSSSSSSSVTTKNITNINNNRCVFSAKSCSFMKNQRQQQQQQQQQHLLYRKVLWGRAILFLLFPPFFAFFAKVIGTPNTQQHLSCVFACVCRLLFFF